MSVPTGNRDIASPGSLFYPAVAEDPEPVLLHIGDPLPAAVYPSMDDPTDETWLRLEPASVSGGLIPVQYATKRILRKHEEDERWVLPRRDRRLVPKEPGQYVHTIGPFVGHRAVVALRAVQHRRLSLTFASRETRLRFYDVEASLDVELRLLREATFWLDFLAEPVPQENGVTAYASAARRQSPLERIA